MRSILPPTIRCLGHSPANQLDSAWDDHPLTYTQKAKKSLFEPPFRALRGNVRTPSMARWKARGRLYIHRNWTFSLSPTVETLWAEIGWSRRFSKGGRSLWAQISEGMGRRPPTTVGIRVADWLRFRVVSKYLHCSASFSFSTMHACDGQTDGRTELRLPRPPSHTVIRRRRRREQTQSGSGVDAVMMQTRGLRS